MENEIEQLSMPFLEESGEDASRETDIKRVLRLKEVRHKNGPGPLYDLSLDG